MESIVDKGMLPLIKDGTPISLITKKKYHLKKKNQFLSMDGPKVRKYFNGHTCENIRGFFHLKLIQANNER